MKHILITDDSEVVGEVICTFLEKRLDVEICVETSDGHETVDWAMALQTDVIILDVLRPKLNGIEAAALLRKKLPNSTTILFTTYADYFRSPADTAAVNIILPRPNGLSPFVETVDHLSPETAGDEVLFTE